MTGLGTIINMAAILMDAAVIFGTASKDQGYLTLAAGLIRPGLREMGSQ